MKPNKKLVQKIREIIEQEMSKRRDPLEKLLYNVEKADNVGELLNMVENKDHLQNIKDYFDEHFPGKYKNFVENIMDITSEYIDTIYVNKNGLVKPYISAHDVYDPAGEKLICKSGDVIKIGSNVSMIAYVVKLYEKGENIDDSLYRGLKIISSGIETIEVYKDQYHPKSKISNADKDSISNNIRRYIEKRWGGDVNL